MDTPRRFFGSINTESNVETGAFKFGSVIFYQFCLRQIQGLFQWKELNYKGEVVLWPHILNVPLTYDEESFRGQ